MSFLTAQWRHLVMLNYEIDPAILMPRVPAGTELDGFEGKTYVSLVGFMFLDTRLGGIPVPWHVHFEEVNLRFYVRRNGVRGVVFVREIVPRVAVAVMANIIYNEPYVALPMRHLVAPDRVRYEWRFRGRWNRIGGRPNGPPRVAGPLEQFITEHYWGYCRQRDGGTVEYEVRHPSWTVADLADVAQEVDVEGLYGAEFIPALQAPPASAFVVDGSAISVEPGRRLLLTT